MVLIATKHMIGRIGLRHLVMLPAEVEKPVDARENVIVGDQIAQRAAVDCRGRSLRYMHRLSGLLDPTLLSNGDIFNDAV